MPGGRGDVYRPYTAADFDFLLFVQLPTAAHTNVSTWMFPMQWLVKLGLITHYREDGALVPGQLGAYDFSQHPQHGNFAERWDFLQQGGVIAVVDKP